jgi:phytoene/squalene synthetase
MIEFEVERTEAMFDQGDRLLPMLDATVRSQVALFGQGGRAILRAIRRQGFNTVSSRPSLSAWQKGRLIFAALVGKAGAVSGQGRA